MSVKALSLVFERSHAKDSAFTVAIALADWCDQNGRCYPSYGQIAKKARVSRATAITAIQQLVAIGEWSCAKKGTAPKAEDEEAPSTVRSQWRNTYQCLLMRRSAEVVQASDYLPLAEVVQPAGAGGPTATAQVVQPTRAHIRNEPSGDPSDQPSGRDLRPSVESYVAVWNGTMTPTPIAQVRTLTPKRRRLLKAAQVEHPPAQWATLCAKVAASRFCRGENTRGWTASLDWLIGSPDPAVRVLEGQFDDAPGRLRPNALSHTPFTCPHDPVCLSRSACDVKTRIARAS